VEQNDPAEQLATDRLWVRRQLTSDAGSAPWTLLRCARTLCLHGMLTDFFSCNCLLAWALSCCSLTWLGSFPPALTCLVVSGVLAALLCMAAKGKSGKGD
jgi:hypothetical protein